MLHADDVEDGEISDNADSDVIEPYKALERPSNYATAQHSFKPIVDDTDESSESSSSSEDSDDRHRPAKRQKTTKSKIAPRNPTGKGSIWSSVIFEDHIERELKDIDVHHGKTAFDRSRDVESYNYPQSARALSSRLDEEDLDEESERIIRRKLKQLDKKDGGDSFAKEEKPKAEDFEQTLKQTQKLLSSRKRKMDQRDTRPKKISPKLRLSRVGKLSVTVESSDMEVAQDIALQLHEDKMDLILRVVELLGKETAIELFEETKEVEDEGGILVADGSRRRTPGGVFLHILRNHDTIPMEKIREVFSEEAKNKEKHKRFVRAKRRQTQTEKLKQSLAESGDLPPLPTRAELEIQKCLEQQVESSNKIEDLDVKEEPIADDEDVVDIHFDCD